MTLISRNVSDYQQHKLSKEFRVDYHKSDQHVPFYIDITLFNAPCSIVALDYRDMMGQDVHEIPVEKKYIDTFKNEISPEVSSFPFKNRFF